MQHDIVTAPNGRSVAFDHADRVASDPTVPPASREALSTLAGKEQGVVGQYRVVASSSAVTMGDALRMQSAAYNCGPMNDPNCSGTYALAQQQIAEAQALQREERRLARLMTRVAEKIVAVLTSPAASTPTAIPSPTAPPQRSPTTAPPHATATLRPPPTVTPRPAPTPLPVRPAGPLPHPGGAFPDPDQSGEEAILGMLLIVLGFGMYSGSRQAP